MKNELQALCSCIKHTVALAMAKLASPETAFTLFSDFISRLTLCIGKICKGEPDYLKSIFGTAELQELMLGIES